LSIPISQKESLGLSFLYQTCLGRCLLWILIRPWISKVAGCFLNTCFSKWLIQPFIRRNKIDMSRFSKCNYPSFNAFFCRSLNEEKKVASSHDFIAPCDGKLSVYKITEDLHLHVKHSDYSLQTLLKDNIATHYQNGWCLIFRLTPDDYHRYHFCDDGCILRNYQIPGVLHTVRPIALENVLVFQENTREVTIMDTQNFGLITEVEVGALLVGKIKNDPTKKQFHKGEEKGMFLFGGSTIILFLEADQVNLNPIFLKNTEDNYETIVHYQDILGKKIRTKTKSVKVSKN